MTRATVRLFLLAGTTAATTMAGTPATPAQTSTPHPTATAHHTTAAHRSAAQRPGPKSDCTALPAVSPKIPALPTGSPCAKSMITVSEKIELSPLMGPMLRQGFTNLDSSFTLAYIDTRIGTGAPAQPHMYYTVAYTGYLTDGTKFDSSLDHGDKKTLSFPYGAHRVIPGWDLGFEGMRLGGKRRLFVPWQLAYGERGKPPSIPAKAELVFDMELIAQSPADPDAPPTPPTPPSTPGSGTPGAPTNPNAPVTPGAPANPNAPAKPGSPTSGAILGNPPAVTVPQGTAPTPPQRDHEIHPLSTPSATPSTTTPPHDKLSPQGGR